MARYTYHAQRATTKQWLDRDLPLETEGPTWTLSSAGELSGTIEAAYGQAAAIDGEPVLVEWGTLIHVDADGELRGSYIVHKLIPNDDGTLQVETAGFSSYLHGTPFDGDYVRIGVDPADVVRHIWSTVQSHPDGDLGVTVIGSTPIRIGTEPLDGDTNSGPYELVWTETPDCGAEIDTLATEAGFDWIEQSRWDGDEVRHEIEIVYPRAGRRRFDLAFRENENVVSTVLPAGPGDEYANNVMGLGAGEGRGALRVTLGVRDGRLRRVAVLPAKDVYNEQRLTVLTRADLVARQPVLGIEQVTVIDHPNAPLGSWELGDTILIQAAAGEVGADGIWCRIVGWQLAGEHSAVLLLEGPGA